MMIGQLGISCLCLLLVGCLLQTEVEALNKFGVLEVAKGFADSILSAGRGNVPDYNAGIFTESVQGQIDVFGKLDGREIATDFLFGMFDTSASTSFSPIGKPVSYNVTALAVQHDVTSLSIIYQLEYPSLNETLPFQIDGWLRVNGDREIEAFDLVFRHFPSLMDQVVSGMEPRLGEMLGQAGVNLTVDERLSAALVQSICSSATSTCQGDFKPYDDMGTCVSSLSAKPLGEWYRLQDDTILCRSILTPLISRSAERYCPALSFSSQLCTRQSYSASINEPTSKGWLAPKFVSPENEKFVEGIYAVSGEPLHPLLKMSLAQDELHSWDPTLYATMTFVYFIFFYAFAHASFFVFDRMSPHFKTLPYELQKNVIMYFMNIIFTTIALALQLAPLPIAFGHYANWEIQTMRTAAILLSSLYIFELVFRFNMRYPLIAHHFFTILAISLGVTLTEYTQSPTYVVSSIIWMLQATTEQPTFIGLLGYRMHWSKPFVAKTLKFASIQTFVIKTASAIGVFVYWAINQRYTYQPIDIAWSVLTILIVVGLMATQVWGSWVTYMIGVRVEQKYQAAINASPSNENLADKMGSSIPMSSGRTSRTYNDRDDRDSNNGDQAHVMQHLGTASTDQAGTSSWTPVSSSGLIGPQDPYALHLHRSDDVSLSGPNRGEV